MNKLFSSFQKLNFQNFSLFKWKCHYSFCFQRNLIQFLVQRNKWEQMKILFNVPRPMNVLGVFCLIIGECNRQIDSSAQTYQNDSIQIDFFISFRVKSIASDYMLNDFKSTTANDAWDFDSIYFFFACDFHEGDTRVLSTWRYKKKLKIKIKRTEKKTCAVIFGVTQSTGKNLIGFFCLFFR